jgi:hypothetical protein
MMSFLSCTGVSKPAVGGWQATANSELLIQLQRHGERAEHERDRGRIARHTIHLHGRRSVASVTRNDIDGFMHDVATGKTTSRQKTKPRGLSVVPGGRGVASRSVGLLGAIFTYAVRKGLRFDNPAHAIVRFADGIAAYWMYAEERDSSLFQSYAATRTFKAPCLSCREHALSLVSASLASRRGHE